VPALNNAFKERLSKSSEITITVTGRKSGRPVSIPVWFVFGDDKLYLLPVKGSDTQWYKNVLKNPSFRMAVLICLARGNLYHPRSTPKH
jgi:deazaflavin-dependent oxidoreductase (nitroreductase family)